MDITSAIAAQQLGARQNAAAQQSTPVIATSLSEAHLSAAGAERILEGLISSLTGDGIAGQTSDAVKRSPPGTCDSAAELARRVEGIARLAERVQNLVVGAQLQGLGQGLAALDAALDRNRI